MQVASHDHAHLMEQVLELVETVQALEQTEPEEGGLQSCTAVHNSSFAFWVELRWKPAKAASGALVALQVFQLTANDLMMHADAKGPSL